jgi:hypothetical protein
VEPSIKDGAGWHDWKILAWQSPTSLTLLAERSFF